MDAAGVLDTRYDEVDDLVRARHVPSSQLIGTAEPRSIDVNTLTALGVRVVGRLAAIKDGVAQLSGSLRNVCTLADLKMNRLLATIDEWCRDNGLDGEIVGPHRFEPTAIPPSPLLELALGTGEFGTVIWACGYRPDHSWVHLPVHDRRGRIRHDGGVVTDAPGVYLLGGKYLRRRRSAFISGAVPDTRDLSEHLCSHVQAVGSRTRTREAQRAN
jgi:putative flavoprotein involved in K+ transport